jgi:hypothetical protein
MTSDKLSAIVTAVLCFGGLFWQMFVVTAEYSKYNIVSEVKMTKDRNVRPPAISLCMPYVEDIDWSRIGWNFTTDEWVRLNQKTRDFLTMDLQQNWTIRKIMEETFDLETMKTSGWIRRVDSYEVEREDEFMFSRKYLRDDLVCFRIYHADTKRNPETFHFKSHRNSYGEEPGAILSISLDKHKLRRVTKFSVFLHSNNLYPRGDADFPFIFISSNSSSIFSNGSTYIGLSYTQSTQHFLPPPFETNCFDYSSDAEAGLNNQEHCIDRCMRIRVLERFNETSFTATFTKPWDFRIMSKYSVHLLRTKENIVDRIYDNCLVECSMIECHQTRYLPALVATRDSDDITFTLYQPNGPETTIKFHPKMNIMDFYVQVMSICGVWLGISLADIIVRPLTFLLHKQTSLKQPILETRQRSHRMNRFYH